MPIYEYVCEACGRLTEVMQRMTDPAPAACPECGAPKLARLISRTSFQLKGGGWYSDLYSTPKTKPEAAPPAAGAKPADSAKPAESARPVESPKPAVSGSAGSATKPAPKKGDG